MADNTNGTSTNGRVSTVSPEADIKGTMMKKVHTYEDDLQELWDKREEVYDIGAVDSPFRVQGTDTYRSIRRKGDWSAESDFGSDGYESEYIKDMGERRANFENNCRRSKKRLRAMNQVIGKKLICTDCKEIDQKTGEIVQRCTWHMSGVANVQVEFEIFARDYINALRDQGRLSDHEANMTAAQKEAALSPAEEKVAATK